MRDVTAFTTRAARLLFLLMAVAGHQPVSAAQAAEPASPAHVSPAALLAGSPVPLPVSGIERQGGDGDGRAASDAHAPVAAQQAPRGTASSACRAGLCPWRASDALSRAGRRSSPSTAPPPSPV